MHFSLLISCEKERDKSLRKKRGERREDIFSKAVQFPGSLVRDISDVLALRSCPLSFSVAIFQSDV